MRAANNVSAAEPRIQAYAREELEKRCVENGLDPDDVLLSLRVSPYITQLPAIAEDAREEGQPHTWRYRLQQDAGAPPLPDWWAVSGGPLVYLTFGTVAPTIGFYPQLYLDVLSGLADLKARVLVTVSRSVDPAVLGALPAHVHVERWVEQERVMPYTTAMIGHGGFGTTLKALTSAVPQVVIPLFADQWLNADRVDALGAGIALHGGPPAARGAGAAVKRLIKDASFRDAANRVAEAAAALPPAAAMIERLEALAS